jgi:hypothetical protein
MEEMTNKKKFGYAAGRTKGETGCNVQVSLIFCNIFAYFTYRNKQNQEKAL